MARIDPSLVLADRLGSWKARWGIGRMNYLVPAGIYAVGTPTADDPVVVTANYKMSYDLVRQALTGRNVWLLVLETFGINVWCAAGKGTFGTDELVNRLAATALHKVVRHRQLILPLLGAPGVAAHEVAKRSGFSVSYAAIRAADLPVYLDNGRRTTPAMHRMTFTFRERLVLIPVEIVLVLKSISIVGGLLFLAALFLAGLNDASALVVAYLGAVFTGVAVAPALLPWLPGKSFAVKGVVAGALWTALLALAKGESWGWTGIAAAFLALPAVSAYYTLNFTGCTTFTSRSGVKKELRVGLPLMGGGVVAGIVLLLVGEVLQ